MSAPRSSSGVPGRPSPTQKLDQGLVERYKANPKKFQRATNLNLLVVLALLVLGGGLVFAGVHTVGVQAGGLALAAMGLFPILLALAALDDVRWRRALASRGGVPPPQFRWMALLRGSSRSKPSKPQKPEPSK